MELRLPPVRRMLNSLLILSETTNMSKFLNWDN
jgi:hypothetical protein